MAIKEEPIDLDFAWTDILDSWEEKTATEAERPYSPSQPWPCGSMDVSVSASAPSPPPSPGQTPPGTPPPPPSTPPSSPPPPQATSRMETPASPPPWVAPWSVSNSFGGLRPPFSRMLDREDAIVGLVSLPAWREEVNNFLRLPMVASEEELKASDLIAVNLLCGYVSAAEEEQARREATYRHHDRLRVGTVARMRQRRQRRRTPYPSGQSSHSPASLAEWRLD